MLNEEEIKKQIFQFLSDKKLSAKEKAAFLLAAIDVVRHKFALEVEESLSEKDIAEIEKIPDDQQAMTAMVECWQKNTGKKPENRLQEIILDFFEKFLTTKA